MTLPAAVSRRRRITRARVLALRPVQILHQILLAGLGRKMVFGDMLWIIESERSGSGICRIDIAFGLINFAAIAACKAVDPHRRGIIAADCHVPGYTRSG